VFCAYEADYYKLWWDTAADWYKKGYIRSDILSVPNPGVDQPKIITSCGSTVPVTRIRKKPKAPNMDMT
jgi:hypothetical protein